MLGCGSSPRPVAVTITQGASASLDNGQTKTLAVTIANDSRSAGVAWTLSSGPGTLSGATTSAVTYNAPASGAAATATVTATSIADATKSASITLHISPVPTIADTPEPPAGTNGSAFTYSVPVSGGTAPLSWSVSAGALPTGLTLSQSGIISGTPNANATLSPYTCTARVQDAAGVAATYDYSLTINNPAAPVISTTAPSAGTNGTAYSAFTFVLTSGGLAPFTWSETGALPVGMTLSAGGVLSGTPHEVGSFPITVSVQDHSNPQQTASHGFTLQINNPPAPAIITASLPNGTVGIAYNQTIQATAGLAPFSWSVSAGTLPAGLSLGSSTTNSVTLSGTPTAAASSTFTIQITDAVTQTGTQAYTVTTSNPPAPTITTASLPNGAVNTAYSQTIQATGGLAPFAWSVSAGTLPAGLNLGSSTTTSVTVSGTPTTTQSNVEFAIQVMDSLSQAGSRAYSVDIAALPIIMLTARVEDTDKIIGLELGADDYITKPFNPREVVARVRAMLRRPAIALSVDTGAASAILEWGAIRLDSGQHIVTVAGKLVDLTPTEYDLLRTFMENPGYVFTRASLIEHSLGYDYESLERTLDTHIKNLRRKIEPDPRTPTYIQTVYGVGYRLEKA